MADKLYQVGIVLAAGHARRFGSGNKLLADFRGAPLGQYCARAMGAVGLDHRIAVVNTPGVARLYEGYDLVFLDGPENTGLADSIRAGVTQAIAMGADRILIALADMPLVSSTLMETVLDRCSDISASCVSAGNYQSPPACFPKVDFHKLLKLSGDQGAGALISDLADQHLVRVPTDQLRDIDTQQDLLDLQNVSENPVASK